MATNKTTPIYTYEIYIGVPASKVWRGLMLSSLKTLLESGRPLRTT